MFTLPNKYKLLFLLILLSSSKQSIGVTLYDGSLGTLPNSQGFFTAIDSNSSESYSGGALLNTSANQNDTSGYFLRDPFFNSTSHPAAPVLDRTTGYRIGFELQILSETHANRDDNGDGKFDRAGYSLIAISNDLMGLELGFFQDRVWAYAAAGEGLNSRFTQAEFAGFNTGILTRYELSVDQTDYTLLAEDTPILSGSLRDYHPSGVSAAIDPYDNPNLLFFGDDTSSASSTSLLTSISFLQGPAVGSQAIATPAPTTGILLLGGLAFLMRRQHRQSY